MYFDSHSQFPGIIGCRLFSAALAISTLSFQLFRFFLQLLPKGYEVIRALGKCVSVNRAAKNEVRSV